MPKPDPIAAQTVYRCIEPFATAVPGGRPEEYNLASEVRADHPILAGVHRPKFEPVIDGVLRREQLPQAFGPGGFTQAQSAPTNNESETADA